MKRTLQNKFVACLLQIFLLMLIFLPKPAFSIVKIVAAENFYGQTAQVLGGDKVEVRSILENPQQDPHFFSAVPKTAKQLSEADVVIYNGLDYDPWMQKLLSSNSKKQQILIVSDLIGAKTGANPHIWYNPNTMSIFAQKLTQVLTEMDPANRVYYQNKLKVFLSQQQDLLHYINALRNKNGGLAYAATEPLFNDMAALLNFSNRNEPFQWQVMGEGAPSPTAVKDTMNLLNQKQVKLLIYNEQVTSTLTDNIKETAAKNNIPIVGMSETQPANLNYQQWMQTQLQKIADAVHS